MQTQATIEARQQALLALCDTLEDEASLAEFKAQVRALLAAEAEGLAGAPEPVREEQQAEAEEFEAFADEVLKAEFFDAAELKRFATAWTLGHLRSAAKRPMRPMRPLRPTRPMRPDGTGIRT